MYDTPYLSVLLATTHQSTAVKYTVQCTDTAVVLEKNLGYSCVWGNDTPYSIAAIYLATAVVCICLATAVYMWNVVYICGMRNLGKMANSSTKVVQLYS